MELELLHYSDKITVLNPAGNTAILTLWSKVDTVMKKYRELAGEFPPCVAAISNYYGDGLNQLLVNLAYNPQIRNIVVVGNNRTGSAQELDAYFENGVEKIKLNGSDQYRVKGTTRLVNEALADPGIFAGTVPDHLGQGFWRRPNISILSEEKASLDEQLLLLRASLAFCKMPPVTGDCRIRIELKEPKIEICPSIQAGHQIVSDNPLDAWGELLFCIQRYGLPTKLAKGDRKELLNLKVVITDPKDRKSVV